MGIRSSDLCYLSDPVLNIFSEEFSYGVRTRLQEVKVKHVVDRVFHVWSVPEPTKEFFCNFYLIRPANRLAIRPNCAFEFSRGHDSPPSGQNLVCTCDMLDMPTKTPGGLTKFESSIEIDIFLFPGSHRPL
jgi:hypothetical protein